MRANSLMADERTFFKMDTLTDFKWDKMYIFAGNITSEDMNKRLGFIWEYSNNMGFLHEGNQMIVFVKNNKVVSSSYFLEGDKNYIDFEIGGMENYTPVENSIFSIDKNIYHDEVFTLRIIHPQEKNIKLLEWVNLKKTVKLK